MSCSVNGCDRPARARGWCDSHYRRWRRTGAAGPSELRTYVQGELAARIAAHVDAPGECWIWTGAIDNNGYGRVSLPDTVGYAHRVSYEAHVGPIPDGLTIDHLCRVRHCCNPIHLEPVTGAENTRRGFAARAARVNDNGVIRE